MTKVKTFKAKFPDFIGAVDFFTFDCEQVNFINVEDSFVEYTTTISARCGCCSDIEEHIASLDEFFEFMADEDFDLLCEEVAKCS
jgi:hypothetical protein